jgi:hypothetical protein
MFSAKVLVDEEPAQRQYPDQLNLPRTDFAQHILSIEWERVIINLDGQN